MQIQPVYIVLKKLILTFINSPHIFFSTISKPISINCIVGSKQQHIIFIGVQIHYIQKFQFMLQEKSYLFQFNRLHNGMTKIFRHCGHFMRTIRGNE